MKAHVFAATLSSAQRSYLKGLAHALRPVVQVGGGGISDTVKAEIARVLDTHELVKVQLPGNNSASEKEDAKGELEGALPTRAHVVARLGRTVILYLEKDPTEAKVTLRRA